MLKLQLLVRERWKEAWCQLGLKHDSASFSCYQKPIGHIALYFHIKPLTQSAKSPYSSESLHRYHSKWSIATHYKPVKWKDDLELMTLFFLEISKEIITCIMTNYKVLRAYVERKSSLLSCVCFRFFIVKDSKMQSTSSGVNMI